MKAFGVSLVLMFTALSAEAVFIVFDFATTSGANLTGLDLDGLAASTSSVTAPGFTVTLDASANTGVFNFTSSPNFGINATESGDVTDAFDAGTGISEVMTFSFSTSVPATISFVSIDFDRITGTGLPGEDLGNLTFAGGSSVTFNGTNVDGSDLLTVNESITAGQFITLVHLDGNGFGIESITLEVTPISAVPEPGPGIPLIAGLFLVGALVHRRSLGDRER